MKERKKPGQKRNNIIENDGGLVKPFCEHYSHNGRYILGDCMSRKKANEVIEDHYEKTGHTETDYFTC